MVKSKVKYIQSLSHKKQRDLDGVFVVEGPKIVNELLSSGLVEAVELFALKEWINSAVDATKTNVAVEEIDEMMLHRISSLSKPNQVLGIFRKPAPSDPKLKGNITLLTDTIQDPGNMGSIIRCADWFGITQVICTPECADAYGPKSVQSSMGSIGRVQVFVRDLVEVVASTPTSVYAATLDGTDVSSLTRIREGLIVIGNESKGISAGILSLPVSRITIPRKGSAESLNAAVAAGIILSHLVG